MSEALTEVSTYSATVVVPEPGEAVTASSVRVPLQSLANRTFNIHDGATVFAGAKTFNGAITCNAGADFAAGTVDVDGVLNCDGAATFAVGVSFTAGPVEVGGILEANGTTRLYGRLVPRTARIALSDAAHTVGVAAAAGVEVGRRFYLPSPAAPRIITLKHTSTAAPEEGETMEFIAPSILGGGVQYTFQRENATVVATFTGSTVASTTGCLWLEVEYVSGVWRMGASSGLTYDGGAPDVFGVIPGAGA